LKFFLVVANNNTIAIINTCIGCSVFGVPKLIQINLIKSYFEKWK